jgi:dihydroneopterin aldolase
MKRLFFAILVAVASFAAQAQEFPEELVKGFKVKVDEFTGVKTYNYKSSLLSIRQHNDTISLQMHFSCVSYDCPLELQRIYVRTNEQTTTFEHNEHFTMQEKSEEYVSQQTIGHFGWVTPMGVVMGGPQVVEQISTKYVYVEAYEFNPAGHMDMVRSMAANLGKIKFEGKNGEIIHKITKKEGEHIQHVLDLFDYMKSMKK